MSKNVFTPNIQPRPPVEQDDAVVPDAMSDMLLQVSRAVLIIQIFLLPLFFLPGLWATLGFQKILVATSTTVLAVSCLSLLMLRQSRVWTTVPVAWCWFLGLVAVGVLSAIVSDDIGGAIQGVVVETGTVTFMAVMASLMGLPLILQQSKRFTMRALQALVGSAFLILLYIVTRLFFGPILAFDSFSAVTLSPVGGFNDMAVFAGLCVIVSLIALAQLPLKLTLQAVLSVVVVLSLIVLAAVNFTLVWIIIGFFALLILLYVVSRDSLFATSLADAAAPAAPSYVLIATTALVCLVSGLFIVLSDVVSEQVTAFFGISYLEVRPSFVATMDIAQGVYQDQLLFGTGPNQFVDGWRQFKDPNINSTIFWATDFTAGSSYVTTLAVTTGVVGLAFWLLFQLSYLWFGFRMLVRSQVQDKFWYFVGVVSFASAAFLWLMAYLYVPGTTILLLAAVLTGLSFVAGSALLPNAVRVIPLVSTRQRGFGLMAIAILVISASVGTLFTISEQYLAHAGFNKTQATAPDLATIDQAALTAYGRYPDDSFLGVRARIGLLEMNQLLALAEPTETEQQQFLNVSSRALAAANQAVNVAPRNPEHHAILAAIYNNLALAGVPDALQRSTSSLETAKSLDPNNPTYQLIEAQMAARRGDTETARRALLSALEKKRNFTEALFLLAQVDIADGNTQAAIDATQAMITLEPANPTRYYQLGILLTANGDAVAAQAAYTAALQLDPNYANARYFRALLLADAGNTEQALAELRIVQATNQENEQLAAVIAQLSSGATTTPLIAEQVEVPVGDPAPSTDAETVTSPVVPESDLLTPLNTVPTSQNPEAAAPSENPEATQAPATSTASAE